MFYRLSIWEFREKFEKKPRDYRVVAHRDFIRYAKKRKPRAKVRRTALRKQLNYLKRNIRLVNEIIGQISREKKIEAVVPFRLIDRFKTIREVYDQQSYMYQNKVNKVDGRIVSLSQPHIRPIVRGKAGKHTEFGAKISLRLCAGFSFVDHLSWDSYNE